MTWLRQNWLLVLCIGLLVLPAIIYFNKLPVQSYVEYFVPNSNGLRNLFYTWQPVSFGSNGSLWLWRLFPLSAYYELFSAVHLSPSFAQALLLAGLRLAGFLGFLALARQLYKDYPLHRNAMLLAGLLFVYNPYTLNYHASSYIVLLAYYLLPVQLTLFVRMFSSRRWPATATAVVLLALTNAVCFGVNLVYDVIAIAAMAFLALFYVSQREVKLRRVITASAAMLALTGLLTIWWILPMISSSTSDAETASYVLNSESFYNLDTSPLNLLRGLGEWGFFSGYKGEYYHNFAGWYRNSFLITISSLLLIAFMFYALSLLSDEKHHRLRKLLIVIAIGMVLLFPFIGGTNPAWPTAGLMDWAFQHIPYFSALRNTYKWMSLVMLFQALVVMYGLHAIYSRPDLRRFRPYVPAAFIIFALFVTAPIWTGTVYEKSTLSVKLPDYWQKAIAYMNANEAGKDSRTFLLPNQYFSVYQWPHADNGQDVGRIGFPDVLESRVFNGPVVQNVCKGCGQYNSAKLLEFMYTNPHQANMGRLMGLTNISSVLQRNDYDYKYYDVESPAEIKQIAAEQGLTLRKQFGQLDLYDLPKGSVYPRIYSPSNIVQTNDLDSSLDIFDHYDTTGNSTAFVLKGDTTKSRLDGRLPTNFYSQAYNTNADNIRYGNDTASHRNAVKAGQQYVITRNRVTGSSSYSIYYRYAAGAYQLRFQNIDGQVNINGQPALTPSSDPSRSVSLPASRQDLAIEVDGTPLYLTPNSDEQLLTSQKLATGKALQIRSLRQTDGRNLLPNPSFETGAWNKQVVNCNANTNKARLQARLSPDASDGKQSLYLQARDDTACMFSPAISSLQPGSSYLLSFDYKQLKGAAPAFCAWDGTKCIASGPLKAGSGWQTARQVISTTASTKQLLVYIYAPTDNFPETEALFDNFKVSQLAADDDPTSLTLPDLFTQQKPVTVASPDATVDTVIVRDPTNLITNGSFEAGSWKREVSNCQEKLPLASTKQATVADARDGKRSLELSASLASACISTAGINGLDSRYDYVLSLDYKVVDGQAAKFCVWDGKTCIKGGDLPAKDRQWQTYQVGFAPEETGKPLFVYLYAEAKAGGTAKVRYDKLSLHRIDNDVLGAYGIKQADQTRIEPMKLDYRRYNPTRYSVGIEAIKPGMVILQESYQPLWQAVLVGTTTGAGGGTGKQVRWTLPAGDHKLVNGYANGWLLDPARLPKELRDANDLRLELNFLPQSYFYKGLAVSGVTMLLSLGYLAWYYRQRSRARQRRHITYSRPGRL